MSHQPVLGEEISPSNCVKLLGRRDVAWKEGFWRFPNVQEAFRAMFAKAAANVPPPPAWSAERGLIIAAGGWRWFPQLYTTVCMIRESGWTAPIQVWYLGDKGELDSRMQPLLYPFGVEWVDACEQWRTRPEMRLRLEGIDHGWLLKPIAVAYCPFAEVVSLDADSYPVASIDAFLASPEYQAAGNAFWPDFNYFDPDVSKIFDIAVTNKREIEAGTIVIDKRRWWPQCWLTTWLNCFHDYTWRHVHGDKDTWALAFMKLKTDWWQVQPAAELNRFAFIHKDAAGEPLFVHRAAGKLKFLGSIDGQPLENRFVTSQIKRGNIYDDSLPGEFSVHRFSERVLAEMTQLAATPAELPK